MSVHAVPVVLHVDPSRYKRSHGGLLKVSFRPSFVGLPRATRSSIIEIVNKFGNEPPITQINTDERKRKKKHFSYLCLSVQSVVLMLLAFTDSVTHIFAYGSNMYTERIRARAASATPVATGYVTHRRLAFHKRGKDGSAKANAVFTGRESDRVWGVVFSIARDDKKALDRFEPAYDVEQVVVVADGETLATSIYVARDDAIEDALKPFVWYHRFVIHGAVQHELPADYVQHLHTFETVADSDRERNRRNSEFLETKRSLSHEPP